MRISIDHTTSYRFGFIRQRLTQLVRLTPEDSEHQTNAAWRIDVDCDTKRKPFHDGFGNVGTMLYGEGPIEGIEITIAGEVLTGGGTGPTGRAHEPLPPPLFLRATPLTLADAALVAFANDAVSGVSGAHDRMTALTAAIGDYPGDAEGWDLAHRLAAAARRLDIPTRLVSGFSLVASKDDAETLPHMWCEAFVEDGGWFGFDPATGALADERYVRMAVGLDAISAGPVAGGLREAVEGEENPGGGLDG